ncbi:MAG: hypothetical protein L0323_16300 [Planctomycetes bacterium]|nr:hypothetical protein [Planctomycetota bacterium]
MLKHPRFALSAAALLVFALPPASAQDCGALTFAFSTTGPGCDPAGTGPIPTLTASLWPLAGIPICTVRIQLDSGEPLSPSLPATLALGLSNPAVPIPALAGCTLWTGLDLILGMSPDANGPTLQNLILIVLPDPSLIGTTLQGQAALPVPGGFRVSNGVQIGIL